MKDEGRRRKDEKDTEVATDLKPSPCSSDPTRLVHWILFHPSAFILHPYFMTPRLADWINSTSDFTSTDSLTSSLILSRAWDVLSLEERRR